MPAKGGEEKMSVTSVIFVLLLSVVSVPRALAAGSDSLFERV